MDALDAEVGLIALANRFSSHNAKAIVRDRRIIVLDLQRVQRLVALSAAARSKLLLHWTLNASPGLALADFSAEFVVREQFLSR